MIRALPLASLLVLAACSDDAAEGEGDAAPVAANAERIECAIAGAAFERSCTVERSVTPEGLALIIRASNGSFRRLLVTKDGRGVVAADGAMPATVSPLGPDRIEVAIAADRYRLPATVRQTAGQNPAR